MSITTETKTLALELEQLLTVLHDPSKRTQVEEDMARYIKRVEEEIEKNSSAKLYVLLGRTYFYLEDDPKSIEAFDKAISLDGNDADAHFWRGLIARYNKDLENAQLHFEKATTNAPDIAKYWYELGVLYVGDLKDTAKGKHAFEECVRSDPKYAKGHYQLGCISAGDKEKAQAEAHFKKAIESDPTYAQAYYNLGLLHQLADEHEPAIEHFTKLLTLQPNDWQARSKLIQLNYALNRTEEALHHREILFEKWRQGLVNVPRYCREQLLINGYRVIVYEFFTLGNQKLKYDCQVTRDDLVQYNFSCGSYDMTNAVFMEMNKDKTDGTAGLRMYHFDGYFPGGLHKTYGFHTGEPPYDTVRSKLMEVVSGTAEVLSASGRSSDLQPQQQHA